MSDESEEGREPATTANLSHLFLELKNFLLGIGKPLVGVGARMAVAGRNFFFQLLVL